MSLEALLKVDKATRWGDLESEEEEEESEEEEMEEDQAEVDTESLADGLSSVVSGYSSLPSGLETPEALDLRKGKAGGECCLLMAPLGKHMHRASCFQYRHKTMICVWKSACIQ